MLRAGEQISPRRTRWLLAAIWFCFLLRGCFYASMFPLWEGYDEFAHFGVVRAISVEGRWLPSRDQRGPRDVEESLRLAPVPWEVRGWDVFRSSVTQEGFWNLSSDERKQREASLRAMPPEWRLEESAHGISAYEALQPPLYYWLMAAVLRILNHASLLGQVIALRWIAILISSFAVPLTFAIARIISASESMALGCAAVVAVMPGFASNAARVSNEPLSILLFALLTWLGLRIIDKGLDLRTGVALGLILGLGLLTKAYFLTAVPAVGLLLLHQRRAGWMPAVATSFTTLLVAGWWYVRNILTIGTLSGLAEAVTLRDLGLTGIVRAIPRVPWMRAVDVILVSHLYFMGWSSLTVRSWMYHMFFAVIVLAALGLILRLRNAAVLWLLSLYGFFWLGQLYNVVLQYLTKGLAGSMGWYMYAVVSCEVVLCALAFGRLRRWMVAVGAMLFALLDLYGMHWLAIPYYTGMIGHRANGALGALHLAEFQKLGLGAAFARLAENKPALLSQPVMIALWICYAAGTIILVAIAFLLAVRSNRRGSAR